MAQAASAQRCDDVVEHAITSSIHPASDDTQTHATPADDIDISHDTTSPDVTGDMEYTSLHDLLHQLLTPEFATVDVRTCFILMMPYFTNTKYVLTFMVRALEEIP